MVSEEISKKFSTGTVLDVGTGPGYLPMKIALLNEHLDVFGLDISKDMIRIAWKNAKKAKTKNLHFVVGDVDEIGLADKSVDFAVATMTLHHWTNPAEALLELSRVMKHGGEVVVYELDMHPTPRSKAWMKQNYNVLLRFGLRFVKGHSITVEHAQRMLDDVKDGYAHCKVEQLETPLIKMTLIKS